MLEDMEDDPIAIGQRLERVRKILGLTKRDFAEGAGISEQSYSPFESGKRAISLSASKKLVKRYHLSLDFIHFGKVAELPTRISREL